VRCDVRGLAALFTGFMTPAQLVRAGMMSGAVDDLQALATAFAGDPPTMVDIY
jgi:predicted acetyltransferase